MRNGFGVEHAREVIRRALEDNRARYEAAPIVEVLGEFRDTFDRLHSRVTVELTGGVWSTFARRYAGIGEAAHAYHADRETAREFARKWLAW